MPYMIGILQSIINAFYISIWSFMSLSSKDDTGHLSTRYLGEIVPNMETPIKIPKTKEES